jgi:hypothetical protein
MIILFQMSFFDRLNSIEGQRFGYIRFALHTDPIVCFMSQTLKLYIPKVLSENKVVLLKGIGTLRINYRSAVINQDLSVITPPREEIYFVPGDESRIDPVLVKIVELIAQVDHEEATDLVYSFMKDLQTELRSAGFLSFPNVGWVRQDQWGSLFFEPAYEYIAINRFFGLNQVRLPPALTPAEQEVLADLRETVHEGATERSFGIQNEPKRRWGFIISSVLAVLMALTLAFLAGNPKQSIENEASDDRTTGLSEQTEEFQDEAASDSPKNPAVQIRFKEVGPNFLPVFKDLDPLIDFTEEDTRECVIIVGAFSHRGNVDRMLSRIEGLSYESVVIPGPRLTKVGLRVHCDENQRTTLDWAKREFDENAWIYHKPL